MAVHLDTATLVPREKPPPWAGLTAPEIAGFLAGAFPADRAYFLSEGGLVDLRAFCPGRAEIGFSSRDPEDPLTEARLRQVLPDFVRAYRISGMHGNLFRDEYPRERASKWDIDRGDRGIFFVKIPLVSLALEDRWPSVGSGLLTSCFAALSQPRVCPRQTGEQTYELHLKEIKSPSAKIETIDDKTVYVFSLGEQQEVSPYDLAKWALQESKFFEPSVDEGGRIGKINLMTSKSPTEAAWASVQRVFADHANFPLVKAAFDQFAVRLAEAGIVSATSICLLLDICGYRLSALNASAAISLAFYTHDLDYEAARKLIR